MQHIIQQTALSLAIVAAGALVMTAQAQTASQQQSTQSFDIAPGPLGQVLTRFADQAGLRLMVASDVLADQQSPGLRGNHEVNQGLVQLLDDKGLQGRLNGDVILIEKVPEGGTALELSNISISGKAPGSTTEGTGSYTTYSTSSAARLNLTPQETPQAITVMTRQRLDDQRLESLEDVLQATPGLNVQHVSGYGTDTPTTFARGSTLNSFQIDGVQTSSSLQAYLQNTAIYDRVEIVKGATGLMNSLGSPAATINMVRKRPTFEPQVSLTAEAGNWQHYGSGADISGSLTEAGNVRGRMVVDHSRQGAWVDNYKQDNFTLYGIGELDLSDSTLLTLGASHTRRDTQAPIGRMPLSYGNGQEFPFSRSDTKSPSWTYYDHELNNAFASIEHQFDSRWSGKTEINYTEHNSNSLYGVLGTVAQPGAGSNINNLLRYQPTNRQTTFDSYLTGSFPLFGRDHELIGGITLSDVQTKAPSYTARYLPSGYAISDYYSIADALPKPDEINETGKTVTNEQQKSAYLSTRFSLSDATSLLLGGRVTDWKRDVDSVAFASGSTTERKNKRTGLVVPYVGLVHALDENWSVYVSYTKIFNPQQARFLDINNSPLAPEEGTSYEAGIKASFNEGRLNASLSVYKAELDNRAAWYTQGNRTIYYGADGTESEGVELELNGELAEGWQAGIGYSYNDIRDQNDDRLLLGTPQHIVKAFSTYRLPGALNKVTLGGGVDWTSDVETTGSGRVQEGYALVNVMARYEVSENLTASLHVNNLFDKEYLENYSTWGSYGPPRNFMTSLKYSF